MTPPGDGDDVHQTHEDTEQEEVTDVQDAKTMVLQVPRMSISSPWPSTTCSCAVRPFAA